MINFVDCFAGPWQEDSEDLRDTSIGIALHEIKSCLASLKNDHRVNIRFRILYVEKDPDAFQRLKSFVDQQNHEDILVECINGDFVARIEDIKQWASGHFTFFFIDPKGWKNVVGGKTLSPLLCMKNTEFLINLMYEFLNRAIEIEKHQEDMVEIFGQTLTFEKGDTPDIRQSKVLNAYRNNVDQYYQGKSAYIPILRPGKERVLYFLVYLTRHPLGVSVFKEEAEKLELVQRVSMNEVRIRQEMGRSNTLQLFPEDEFLTNNIQSTRIENNKESAKQFLLRALSDQPLLIDYECWSRFLEFTDLFPGDYQLAMKELVEENLVENLDADVSRRRKKLIKPGHPNKSERWRMKH